MNGWRAVKRRPSVYDACTAGRMYPLDMYDDADIMSLTVFVEGPSVRTELLLPAYWSVLQLRVWDTTRWTRP
jgi:hypothetical protein